MSDALPAPEAVVIFNRLTATHPSDTTVIDQIIWQLRALRRKRPGEPMIAVALLQAFVMRGQALDAIELAMEIWPQRYMLHGDVAITYGFSLGQIGLYDKAWQFVGVDRMAPYDPVEVTTLIHAAWGLGQYEKLMDALQRDQSTLYTAWPDIIDRMSQAGVLQYFEDRQKIIRKHLLQKQCGTHLIFTFPYEGVPELTQYAFMDADYTSRESIVDDIFRELSEFYLARGIDDNQVWFCAPVIVLDQKGRPSPQEETRGTPGVQEPG